GFKALIPDLNSTDESLRALVALTLGSAMQNNVKVQIAAVESNVLDPLLRIISMDTSVTVKSRAVYAVSCLIRQFPFAQKMFLKQGGLSVLASIFKENNLIVDKLKVKIINLLHDILVEQKQALEEQNENKDRYEHPLDSAS
ncbi:nucleotide exchange factor SIL1-like protein, partial [Leptotrombidium deliense]